MLIVARSSPELNLKEACWQQLRFHEPYSKLRESFYFAQTRATSCQYLTSYPTMTNPQQAESATVAGIYIRDSKGKNMMPSMVFDPYNLTSSLKEATRERRQDGKPITDYHACWESNSKTASVKYPHQR